MTQQECETLAELVRSQTLDGVPVPISVLADFCAFHCPGLNRADWLDRAGVEE